MQTKLSQLLELMRAGEDVRALAFAAKFPDLGDHKARITRGHQATYNPSFYIQIKKDPDALIQDGIDALYERYGKFL